MIKIRILDIYSIEQIFYPFVFSLCVSTALALIIITGSELIWQMSQLGLNIEIAIKILYLKIPELIVYVLPVSLLLASLLTYSRLQENNEIVALQSIGISLFRLVIPLFAFSCFVTIIIFTIDNFVVPTTTQQINSIAQNSVVAHSSLKPQFNLLYPEYKNIKSNRGKVERVLLRLFYAREFDGNAMNNVTLIDFSHPEGQRVIVAQSANWNNTNHSWNFSRGKVYLIDLNDYTHNVLSFQKQEVQLPIDLLPSDSDRQKCRQISVFQLSRYIHQDIFSLDSNILANLKYCYYQKIAFSCSNLIFAIAGTLAGLKLSKHLVSSLCFVLSIAFVYYVISFIAEALVTTKLLPLLILAWIPNCLTLLSCLLLLKINNSAKKFQIFALKYAK